MYNNTIISLLIELVNSMAVVVVIAYLLMHTESFSSVLECKSTPKSKLFLIVVFGCLSVYGTLSGVRIFDAVANTRYIGPAVAGFIAGPFVGLGAGAIGGLHRYSVGGYAALPSAISTAMTGLTAGFIGMFMARKGRLIGVVPAALWAVFFQICHLAQILLMESDKNTALKLVANINLPMIVSNGIGTGLFMFIIHNILKERKIAAERNAFQQAKQKIESELSVARDIQMSMVPKMLPKIPCWPGCELFADLHSAKEVGGDLYDFFLVDNNHLYFAVGDVSGKGVPAALFMAVTKTLLKGRATSGVEPHALLGKVNEDVSTDNDSLMFVTVFCGRLDLATGELVFSNAGHNPPVIARKNGTVEWLKLPKAPALGIDPSTQFSDARIILHPGDAIVAYTDGVTEAMNHERKLYSEKRLLTTVEGCAKETSRVIVERVAASVREYAGETPQSDDITLLVLRYTGR